MYDAQTHRSAASLATTASTDEASSAAGLVDGVSEPQLPRSMFQSLRASVSAGRQARCSTLADAVFLARSAVPWHAVQDRAAGEQPTRPCCTHARDARRRSLNYAARTNRGQVNRANRRAWGVDQRTSDNLQAASRGSVHTSDRDAAGGADASRATRIALLRLSSDAILLSPVTSLHALEPSWCVSTAPAKVNDALISTPGYQGPDEPHCGRVW